jgi:hypothetical protein
MHHDRERPLPDWPLAKATGAGLLHYPSTRWVKMRLLYLYPCVQSHDLAGSSFPCLAETVQHWTPNCPHCLLCL